MSLDYYDKAPFPFNGDIVDVPPWGDAPPGDGVTENDINDGDDGPNGLSGQGGNDTIHALGGNDFLGGGFATEGGDFRVIRFRHSAVTIASKRHAFVLRHLPQSTVAGLTVHILGASPRVSQAAVPKTTLRPPLSRSSFASAA